MSGPFRSSDAVLTIAQDNTRQAIEITAANEVAGKIIGYAMEELRGKPFRELLPEKIAEMLDDYVEYEPGANDVGEVLRRVRDFQILDHGGNLLSFRLKVLHHPSQDMDEFLLVLQRSGEQRQEAAFIQALREIFDGHAALSPESNLPERQSLLKGVELVSANIERIPQGASLAVIELDQFDVILVKYGIHACHKLVQGIAGVCRQNLRDNDVIAQVARNRLAIILLDASKEPAKMVLNRLRWLIGAQQVLITPEMSVQTTASIAFVDIPALQKAENLLERCEQSLDNKPETVSNQIIET